MRLPARLPQPDGNLPVHDAGYLQLAPIAPPPPPNDFVETLRKLWRRKGMIALCLVGVMLIAGFAVSQMDSRYSATSRVMIGVPEAKVVKLESVIAGISADAETVQNESYVLRSRELAEQVVARTGLMNDPEFNPALAPGGGWTQYLNPRNWIPDSLVAMIRGDSDVPAAPPSTDPAEIERQRVISVLLSNVEVVPLGRSHVLNVSVTSRDPVKAATLANAFAETYIDQQLLRKTDATVRASTWLDARIAELRQQVEASERAVEDYRRETGIYEARADNVTSQQLAELNTQLILAQSAKAEVDARLRQTQALLKNGGGTDSAPGVLSSPLIGALKQQQAEVERRAAELASQYGERHPRMQTAQAEIRDIQQNIRTEIARVIEGLRNEAGAADARYQALRANLDRIKGEVGTANEGSIRLRALEREAEANRTLLETFLTRSKETATQGELQQADARVISRASVPDQPSFPPTSLVLFLGALGGALLGVLLAFLVEHLDRTFRSSEQVEEMTGLPTLALVPLLKRRQVPSDHVLRQPGSPFSEALRKLHAALLLGDSMRSAKVVMFASAVPNEGKSGLCSSLGRMLARTGRRVVVVDCDWRRPNLHKLMDQPNRAGLAELLTGHATVEEVVWHDSRSGADAIFAGRLQPEQSNLLASDQMRMLLQTLSQDYDMVIVDTPPVLVGAEVLHLSQLVDQTVFVVRWGHTRREVALNALKQLLEAQGRVAGVVLSHVHPRRYRQHGYGQLSYQYVRPASAGAG